MLPPRHGKSKLASQSFPAFVLGHKPDSQLISASATAALAADFGRDVRNLVSSPAYQTLFPQMSLAADSQARDKWHTSDGGIYYSVGVGGSIMGRGAHIALIDDSFGSWADAQSEAWLDNVWSWFTGSLYNRLMPGGAIVVIGHRGNVRDLQGRLLAQQADGGDTYRVVEFPAIDSSGNALWPERYPLPVLERIKANSSRWEWEALYQQHPTAEGGGLLRREWWRVWPAGQPMPEIIFLMQVWDTAYEAKESADYSACTTWGIFFNEATNRHEMMLLGRYRKQVDFPTLRRDAKEYYDAYHKSGIGPVDMVLIEPKATGKPVVQELKRAGVPAVEFQAVRNDRTHSELRKPPKVQAASVVLESSSVWYPEGARWADDVIDECASFSATMTHEHDDLTDTCVMAWLYLRRTWWVSHEDDAMARYGPLTIVPRGQARTDDTIYDLEDEAPRLRVM